MIALGTVMGVLGVLVIPLLVLAVLCTLDQVTILPVSCLVSKFQERGFGQSSSAQGTREHYYLVGNQTQASHMPSVCSLVH